MWVTINLLITKASSVPKIATLQMDCLAWEILQIHLGVPSTFCDTAEACCVGKLCCLNVGQCVADTNGVLSQAQGSAMWYVDWNIDFGTCVKDCLGNKPCGGLKDNWETGHASAAACCDSIPWQPSDRCYL